MATWHITGMTSPRRGGKGELFDEALCISVVPLKGLWWKLIGCELASYYLNTYHIIVGSKDKRVYSLVSGEQRNQKIKGKE